MAGRSPKVCKIFNFLESIGCEVVQIMLAGERET
jgi:hypothetical protein